MENTCTANLRSIKDDQVRCDLNILFDEFTASLGQMKKIRAG
jgi:hypothetical protein